MEITKEQLVEWIQILDTRIQTINDRTKSHTLDIKKLEKQMKDIMKKQSQTNEEENK